MHKMIHHTLTERAYRMGFEHAQVHPQVEEPLSGEWAGSILPRDVYAEIGIDESDDEFGEILDAWEDGYFTYYAGQ